MDLVLADIDPNDAALIPPHRQSFDDAVEPAAVEPHAVDQRAIGFEAEHPRLGIAGLRSGRHRADFDNAETEPQ
jgi:hypothetical protein